MEARKLPLEIARAFLQAREAGLDLRLTYVGARSSSYEWMNEELVEAEQRDVGFTWVTRASDDDLVSMMSQCDAFLSFGTEGYGIPVLESIRRGTPVLFGGIQPAAELVKGLGAIDCGEPTQENIRAAFEKYADPRVIEQVRQTVELDAVPTWADFARAVVQPIVRGS
jgi:glycosyltransferase involved in cell wall biosynthesis